jgi:pilus assembly protein Flp/PilA
MSTPARWRERGQNLVEYGLLLGLIALAVIVGLTLLGGALRDSLGAAAGGLQGGDTPAVLPGGGGPRPLAPAGATPTP